MTANTEERRQITLNQLLEQITPLPWRFAEMDNDKVMPTVRIFGRRKHYPSKETCIGRLDFTRDARYATHAANVLPDLVAAAKHLQQNWENNLTEPMARLNQALVEAETITKKGENHANGTPHLRKRSRQSIL